MGTPWRTSTMYRFTAKVDFDGPNGCWTWTGGVNSRGYGVFSVRARSGAPCDPADVGSWLAHRFAYERIGRGELDPDLTIDHLCENKLCVNPAHLEQVTREENVRRQYDRARLVA